MKRADYDQGYLLAKDYFAALEAALMASTEVERRKWTREAQRLGNKITPASKQAASKVHSEIANAALRWHGQHETFNCSDFIEHCRSHGLGLRHDRGADKPKPLSDSALRKIVAKQLGIKGQGGRPSER